ncbi:agmatine deiminase family protein [uncultured Maricaulis sp.]|uniref:agmatine deiminase family protein n=1 Tax=uncultured Maricaulis sp. TaxID=174710 RepID=UPI0030D98BF3|tara:strand:- start:8228 stop:9253 length:1026 start_codon:yes stop_codon:yes gene_type:complete
MSKHTIPHESQLPDRIVTCWPAEASIWKENLEPARIEFAAFLSALIEAVPGGQRLPLTVLVSNDETEASARSAMGDKAVLVRQNYGDVWTRDTAPVFLHRDGQLVAARFPFNGWGGKFQIPGDQTVGTAIARMVDARIIDVEMIAEGGALEFDGEGTVITTRDVLLNKNRNGDLTEAQVEDRLKAALGVETVLWVDKGLIGDHTDGHVDNLARFVRPGEVVCMQGFGADDPQTAMLDTIAGELAAMTDARGRKLTVHRIPSPGRVVNMAGEVLPASYMNWVIGPRNLVVPTYGTPSEAAALEALRALFTTHTVVGCRSSAILSGGGAFHCVTTHIPAGPKP